MFLSSYLQVSMSLKTCTTTLNRTNQRDSKHNTKMKGFGAIVLLSPLLLVPTIADIEQARGEPRLAIIERLYYALIGQKRVFYSVFSSRFVHENMVLSARNAEAGRYWTYLTYAFIHKDMEHLVSNLAPIISSGATISTIYGK